MPRDIWILLGIVFVTFSLRFFEATSWLPANLRLTPDVWQRGFLWQLVTYPFAGTGAPGFWFVLELLILFMFARDVLARLGRRGFWRLIAVTAASAAIVGGVCLLLILALTGRPVVPADLALMQGQHMLVTILIAAFATLNADATIYLFFVLPIQARWFLGLEILFAFLGYLGSGDLAGFFGIAGAVGFTFAYLGSRPGRRLRELRLRFQHAWFRLRLAWERRRRGLRVVRGGDPPASTDRDEPVN